MRLKIVRLVDGRWVLLDAVTREYVAGLSSDAYRVVTRADAIVMFEREFQDVGRD